MVINKTPTEYDFPFLWMNNIFNHIYETNLFFLQTRMTTFKKSAGNQKNIDKYRVAIDITE